MATNTPEDGYVRTALRLPRELHAAVHEAARAQDRTFNGQIVAMLRYALQAQKTPAHEAHQ